MFTIQHTSYSNHYTKEITLLLSQMFPGHFWHIFCTNTVTPAIAFATAVTAAVVTVAVLVSIRSTSSSCNKIDVKNILIEQFLLILLFLNK